MNKKILITGASGFFGQSIIEALQKDKNNFEAICVSHTKPILFPDSRFQFTRCNLLDLKEEKELIHHYKPTHLLHLAWYVSPQKFWTAFDNLNWLNASINLFKSFGDNGGKVFIGAGSLAEYDWSSGVLDEVKTPLLPNTLYGQCKKSLLEILLSIRNTYYPETKIIWPRIGYFFGPNEPKEKLIPKLIESIKNGLPINLAAAEFKRPYAHVKYLGKVLTKVLIQADLKDTAFNMSASTSYPLGNIVDFVQAKLKKTFSETRYNAYPSAPEQLEVKTDFLKSINCEIPDTFFDDLAEIIRE
jgi:nucleoside-diphosphate-sugar epimerase